MEDKEKFEELKSILEELQKALELYNELNPSQKLTITQQTEKRDVNNIFICVYNGIHVGLFKKINWSTELRKNYFFGCDEYDAGSIYVGINSNYVGMKKTHSDNFWLNKWQPIGTKVVLNNNSYVSNCVMQTGMSFDDMRLIMYSAGKIGPYEIGKATSQEMLDVLKYASSYYQLDQNIKHKK